MPEIEIVGCNNNNNSTKVSPPSDDDIVDNNNHRWKGSGMFNIIPTNEPYVVLGPGQVQPRGYRLTSNRYGELKLGLLITKGMFEVEVIYYYMD